MAEAARQRDVIDSKPPFTVADIERLTARYAGVAAADMLSDLLVGELRGRVAAVSSFGAESAVLLHHVAQVDTSIPVIFVNTQKMFGETLAYRDTLAEQLGFTDLRVFRPDPYLLAQKDKTSLRWSYDPDGCCDLRKVEPLRRALQPFDAWISGRKGFQAGRAALPRFEIDEGRLKYPKLPKEVEKINLSANINKAEGDLDLTHIDVDKFEASVAGNLLTASLHVATPVSDPMLKGSLKGKIDFELFQLSEITGEDF